MSTDGRSVVVTGAAAGIGRAVVGRLVAGGWRVVAVDVDEAALAALAADAPTVVGVAGSVAEPSTIDRAIAAAQERGGRLDAWVNNAAVQTQGRFDLESDERIEQTLDVNLRAPMLGCRAAIRAFLDQGRPGAIVNVSSIHAHSTFAGWVAYATTKGGLEALTRGICVEYGHLDIRCNAIAPGAVLTAATERALDAGPDREAMLDQWRALAPMGVVLAPDDIAAAVAYLLSPDARFVNGHVLRVDAGMAAVGASVPPLPGLQWPTTTEED